MVPERQTQAKQNQKSQEESSGCSFSRSLLLLSHTKQELWQGLNLQLAEFRGTWCIWAWWRVEDSWRISSSGQKAPIKVPADTRSLLLDRLSCHHAHSGVFGACLASLGQSRTPGDPDGSTHPAGLQEDPSPLTAISLC